MSRDDILNIFVGIALVIFILSLRLAMTKNVFPGVDMLI